MVIPMLVALAALLVWGLMAGAAQIRCVDAARAGARAAARSETPADVRRVARASAPRGAEVSVWRSAGMVRVRVTVVPPRFPLTLSAEAAALDEAAVADGGGRVRRDDRGSATVWSLGLMAVLLAVFAALMLMCQAVVARHRAGGAADLAALAAADHALDGRRTACALAARVAAAQGAVLRRCAVSGEISDVVAEVGGARVRSRAGPAYAVGGPAATDGDRASVPAPPAVPVGVRTRGARGDERGGGSAPGPLGRIGARVGARPRLGAFAAGSAPAHGSGLRVRSRAAVLGRGAVRTRVAPRVPAVVRPRAAGARALTRTGIVTGTRAPALTRKGARHPGRPPPSEGSEEADRGGFVEGVVAVAAFGGLDAGGAAELALAGGDGVAGGGEPGAGGVEGAFGEARTAGVAVVDEDGGQAGVGVQGYGHAADVPAVAGGEEREEADGGVFGGVQGAGEFLGVDAGGVELGVGDGPPDGAGAQGARRAGRAWSRRGSRR